MWRLRAPLLALLLMQVILLASSGVTATKKPLGKQETCNMKNHMIEYLRNNGVQIYERPQISTEHCKQEWEAFGSCCHAVHIKEHVKEKIRLNNLALEAVIQEVSSMGAKLADFKESRYQEHQGNGVTFKTASRKVLSPTQVTKWRDNLQKIGKAIIKSQEQQVKSQQKCVAKINSVISKSACSICSGRSDDFFNKKGKLEMSENLCRSVLGECSEAWMSMVDMAANVQEYTRIVRKLNPGRDSDGILEEKGFTMNLDSFITNRNLIPIMNRCRGKTLKDCSFEHVAALCEQFIHIQAPTYIESSQSQAQKILTSLKSADIQVDREVRICLRRYHDLSDFRRNHSDNESAMQREERFRKGVRYMAPFQKMKQLWVQMQLGLPILQMLSEKSVQISDQSKTAQFKVAIRRAQTKLTQIENTIAAAALLMHKTLREFILPPSSYETRQQAEKLWNPVLCLVEKFKHSTYPSVEEQKLFERLEEVAKSKSRWALKKKYANNGGLAAQKLFMQTLAGKIARFATHPQEKLRAISDEAPVSPKQDRKYPQASAGRILSEGMILDPPSEISVVVNPQCNPCLNPEGPGILEEP